MVHVYLVIHDTRVPLEGWRLVSLPSLRLRGGWNSSIYTSGRRWRWWCHWGRWSATRAAVVHQHKAGNHGDNDNATNSLALERHMKDTSSKEGKQHGSQKISHRACISLVENSQLIKCQRSKLRHHSNNSCSLLVQGCAWNVSCVTQHGAVNTLYRAVRK